MSIDYKFILQLFLLACTCIGFIYSLRNAISIVKVRCEGFDKRINNIEDHINECECENKIVKCETCLSFIKNDIEKIKGMK